jgi:hypothetical protein
MRSILLIALATSGLVACKKELATGQADANVGQPFDVVLQQTTSLHPTAGGPARFSLTAVQDSRCPSGAQCIWAGYVAVTIELTDGTAAPQTARISLRYKDLLNYSLDSAAVTLNQQAYWLRLLDVTPYPSLAGSSQPTTAKLRLRPR